MKEGEQSFPIGTLYKKSKKSLNLKVAKKMDLTLFPQELIIFEDNSVGGGLENISGDLRNISSGTHLDI